MSDSCTLLYCITPPAMLTEHSLVSKEAFSAHNFTSRGKWEHVNEHLLSLGVQDAASVTSDPLLSYIIQNTETWTAPVGRGDGRVAGRSEWQARARIPMYQRAIDPTNHFADSIRKSVHELLGHLTCEFPQLTHHYTQWSTSLTHTYSHFMAGSWHVSPRVRWWEWAFAVS